MFSTPHQINVWQIFLFSLYSPIWFFIYCKSFDRYLIFYCFAGWLKHFYCIIHQYTHTHTRADKSISIKVKVSTLFNRNSIHTILGFWFDGGKWIWFCCLKFQVNQSFNLLLLLQVCLHQHKDFDLKTPGVIGFLAKSAIYTHIISLENNRDYCSFCV